MPLEVHTIELTVEDSPYRCGTCCKRMVMESTPDGGHMHWCLNCDDGREGEATWAIGD